MPANHLKQKKKPSQNCTSLPKLCLDPSPKFSPCSAILPPAALGLPSLPCLTATLRAGVKCPLFPATIKMPLQHTQAGGFTAWDRWQNQRCSEMVGIGNKHPVPDCQRGAALQTAHLVLGELQGSPLESPCIELTSGLKAFCEPRFKFTFLHLFVHLLLGTVLPLARASPPPLP